MIVGPGGDYLAGPICGEEDILYADVDMDSFDEKGLMRDITGHYQRADVFHLTVNCEDTPLLEMAGATKDDLVSRAQETRSSSVPANAKRNSQDF